MLDRLTSIEVFLTIAQHGSFTAAAARLGLSRAMVSKHLKALERRLGVRLVDRNTRSIRLTEAGEAYRARIHPVLERLTDLETRFEADSETTAGTLAVAAPTSFGLFHLADAIADYGRDEAGVRIRLLLTDRAVHLIDEGFDVAIVIRDLEDSSLVARRIGETALHVCASPAYLDAAGRPEHPEALARHNCLVFGENVHRDHATWAFGVASAPLTVRVTGDLVANQGDVLRIAALAGRGIARLPGYIVDDELRAGRLESVLDAFEPPRRPISAVYPHREFLPAKVRRFVEFLASRFGRAA